MHVEFRCSDLTNVYCFEPESFYRVKERLAKGNASQENECLALYRDKKGEKRASRHWFSGVQRTQQEDEKRYIPTLQIQIVLEQVIKLESSPIRAALGPKCEPVDNSVIRTKLGSANVREAMLTVLPLHAVNTSVKIRLLQLPPPLHTSRGRRAVERALSSAVEPQCQFSTPLCIGVGKITLRELLSIKGGIRLRLQAKKGIANAVESLIGNAVGTKVMLGSSSGGSGIVTLEVVGFSYGEASLSKLLFCPSRSSSLRSGRSKSEDSIITVDRNVQSSSALWERDSIGTARSSCASMSCHSGMIDSPVIRFFFIPYLAAVDVLLRIHVIVAWQNQRKTALLLCALAVAYFADVLLVICIALVCSVVLLFFSELAHLYRLPMDESIALNITNSDNAHSYLYGRHNKLLNAMVRSYLLYVNGCQEDSFYEIAFVFHLLCKYQHRILSFVFIAGLLQIMMPFTTFCAFCIIVGFMLYPISLCMHIPRSSKRSGSVWTIKGFIGIWKLSRPLKVVSIVYVGAKGSEEKNSGRRSGDASSLLLSPSTSSPMVPWNRPSISVPKHEGNLCQDDRCPSQAVLSPLSKNARRMQSQNISKLSFVVVSLTSKAGGQGGAALLARLRVQYENTENLQKLALVQARRSVTIANMNDRASPEAHFGPAFDNAYSSFLSHTVELLEYIRSEVTIQFFVTPSSRLLIEPDTLMPLEGLIQRKWLTDHGKEDGITATLLELPQCPFMVGQTTQASGATPEARALAAFAAYLIQGPRLSIYSRGRAQRNCCTILPLQFNSSRFERFQPLHRSSSVSGLLSALEEIWHSASQPTTSPSGGPMTVSPEMVCQIVKTNIERIRKQIKDRPTASLTREFSTVDPSS